MKKISSIILTSVIGLGIATAQDSTSTSGVEFKSKRGVNIFPEADEYALGVSASPFLTYMGNFFHGQNATSAPNFSTSPTEVSVSSNSFYFKKMTSANSAIRARFQLDLSSTTSYRAVVKDMVTPQPSYPSYGEDVRNSRSTGFLLSLGMEKRRGKDRVKGVYGAEAYASVFGNSSTFDYFNKFNFDNNKPTTSNFGNNVVTDASRNTEIKTAKVFGLGVRGFIGIEYFFAPKISLGGELGYALGIQTEGKSTTTTEWWNSERSNVERTVHQTGRNSVNQIRLGSQNMSANINLMFYF